MIADVIHPFTCHGVLDNKPDFLIEQEQGQIIEEGSFVLLTQFIISATCDKQCTIAGQVAQGMTKSRRGWLTLGFDRGELSVYDLPVDDDRLEVT